VCSALGCTAVVQHGDGDSAAPDGLIGQTDLAQCCQPRNRSKIDAHFAVKSL
jgi:hypothetical protein